MYLLISWNKINVVSPGKKKQKKTSKFFQIMKRNIGGKEEITSYKVNENKNSKQTSRKITQSLQYISE